MASEVSAENLSVIQRTLETFLTFLERHQWVTRVNTVSFFTEKMWDRVVIPRFGAVAEEIVQLTERDMARLPAGQIPSRLVGGEEPRAVIQFIEECLEHRLENTQILCKIDSVLDEIEKDGLTLSEMSDLSTKNNIKAAVPPKVLMNTKKSHEVEKMSFLTAKMAKMHQLEKVVDIGSGKGYLGQYLTFQYGLDVIGIDSSDSNTHGARDRNRKLLKKWNGISRHSMSIQESQSHSQAESPKERFKEIYTKRTHRLSHKQKFADQTCQQTLAVSKCNGAMDVQATGCHAGSESESLLTNPLDHEDNMYQGATGMPDVQHTSCIQCPSAEVNQQCSLSIEHDGPSSGGDSGLTTQAAVPSTAARTDHKETVAEHLQNISIYSDEESPAPAKEQSLSSTLCITTKDSNTCTSSPAHSHKERTRTETQSGGSFCSVTAFVEPSTSLLSVLSTNSEEPNHESNEILFMLVGLHTCGDLAPSTLRLFVNNHMARALLNIGCCYQHLSEEFETEGWTIPVTKPEVCGFPMSKFLREKGTKVTRSARMLASMAADRIATSQIVPAMGLFYRSVLQVLLQDHYRLPTRSENVGKLAPRCKTFLEYARKALKKLQFDDSKLSDTEISAYSDRFQPYFSQLQAVNQLRVALSPTIEGLFMLDRLCFLHEQEGVHRAAVVQLFDPVTSPRCYGILATRH